MYPELRRDRRATNLARLALHRQAGRVTRPEREYPRYAHEAAVTLYAPDLEVTGRTRNMSRGGLSATLSPAIAVGTDVEIGVQLVFHDGRQSEALRIPGRVVWCTPIDEDHQVGIQFRGLDAQTAEYLTMFLRYLGERAEAPRSDEESAPEETDTAISLDDRFR